MPLVSLFRTTARAIFAASLLSSCSVYAPPPVSLTAGDYRDYAADKREVWKAVVTTLAEKESIRNTDAAGGVVRTDYDLLEDKESGRKLQYSFLAKVDEREKRNVRVYINIRFLLPGQPAWMEDMQAQPVLNKNAENYLRQDLFETICENLSGCKAKPVSVVTAPVILEGREESISGPPSEEVREAQRLLMGNGYYPDPANGLLGRKTRAALKSFQKEYGLPETGRPDAPTLDALRALGGK